VAAALGAVQVAAPAVAVTVAATVVEKGAEVAPLSEQQ
jgi:hypothetical protein